MSSEHKLLLRYGFSRETICGSDSESTVLGVEDVSSCGIGKAPLSALKRVVIKSYFTFLPEGRAFVSR